MKLAPFLLDEWLEQKNAPNSKIEFDLGSSTGPSWMLRELLNLSGDQQYEQLLGTKLFYTSPAGSRELREAIAKLENVDPEHVQVIAGGAEALLIFFFLAAESGANVVLPNPGFPTNTAFAESFGIEIRQYRLRAETGFRPSSEEIRRLVDRNTRFVLVNSPHNPTGAVLSDEEMEALHDFCVDRGVQFISDQVYHPIYHGVEMRSAARLPHATVLGDFSKALCLSGLRTGWIIEHDPHRRELYRNARSYFSVSNTTLGERLAALALHHSETIYARAREVARRNLSLLDQLFSDRDELIQWVRPRGGMTAFPWLRDGGDAREFCRKLANRGVLIAPGDCFGMPSHFRIGFGTSGDQFPEALARFAEFLHSEARDFATV
ncbi:MAG: pyridoxal phosphate-dependent aminotransferase [Acidobacteriaceae bacterium]|nr:pyridoxal phosphate-dependent aminotransferase [Acidobacteriaceae bacterium]MBV9781526.1 pyridoxal phosphate-dependent aminotransferase [Acidobacteriaceae bacterium]